MQLRQTVERLGLKPRLTGLVLAVLLPLTSLQAVHIVQTVAQAKETALQANLELAHAVSSAFLAHLNTVQERGRVLGTQLAGVGADERGRLLMQAGMLESPTAHHFGWVNSTGWVTASTLPSLEGQYLGDQAYLRDAIQGRGEVLSDLLLEPSGEFVFALATPIWQEERLQGVLLTFIDSARLPPVFGLERVGKSRFGLADRSGRIVYRSGVDSQRLTMEQRQLLDGQHDPARVALLGGAATSERFVSVPDGSIRMGAAVPLGLTGWVAFASVPVAQVLGNVRSQAWLDMAGLLAVSLVAFLGAWRIAVSISRPLEELRAVAAQIMSGDRNSRVQSFGVGEVAVALQAFQAMAKHLNAAEAQLRHTAEEQALLLESTTDAFCAVDHNWRFTYVNQQTERILQRSRESLLGRDLWEEFPGFVGSVFEQQYHRAHTEGVSVQFEGFFPPLAAWYEVHAHPYTSGLAIFFRDITERHATLTALAAQSRALELERQRLRAILKILPVGVVIADKTGVLEAVNEEARRIWAHPPMPASPASDGEYRGWWCSTGRQLRSEEWALFRALRYGESPLNEEIEIEAFNGERRTILCAGVPLRDESGAISGAVVVNVDISRQKQLEDAIRRHAGLIERQRAVLQRIAEGAPLQEVLSQIIHDACRSAETTYCEISLLQEDGSAWRISTPGCRGSTERQPAGSTWAIPIRTAKGWNLGELMVAPGRVGVPTAEELAIFEASARLATIAIERHQREAGRAQKLDNLVENMTEGVVALDDNGIITINQAALRLFGLVPGAAAGNTTGLPGGLGPILERLSAEPGPQRLRTTLQIDGKEIEVLAWSVFTAVSRSGTMAILQDVTARRQLQRLQRSFVANVSHELRGPLTTVSATLEAIADGLVPEERRQGYLQAVLKEMARLRRLSYEVIDLTQLDAGLLRPKKEIVGFSAVFRQIAETFHLRAQEAGVGLEIEPTNRVAVGDGDRVYQVVTNLLDNALRYTPAGGKVALCAEERGGFVWVEVTDSGLGIPSEHHALIWERFHKVDSARSFQPGGGTGLGLAIVRELVTLMGGEVKVSSTVGQGSVFSFSLPAASPPTANDDPTGA